ncbi:MAG TPA: phosphodiester glycosidase family protein [Mycobacteriales bacterium]|nr:phosphodiester glycosidase family protein [Mycobacteriales bacterium]
MRRGAISTVGVVAGAAAVVLGAAPTHLTAATALLPKSPYSFCPGPEKLVTPHTHWHHHRLARGVTLAETTAHDRRGRVAIHVLRIDLRNRRLDVRPLHRGLATRYRLNHLAHHRHLVAATNGMYFNLYWGAPKVPLIEHRRPLVLSRRHLRVAGIDIHGTARSARVWLDGTVASHGRHRPLQAVNVVAPPTGLTLYTRAWGAHRVPLPGDARSRRLRNDHFRPGLGRHHHPPRHGELLVARGRHARHWLASLRHRDRVTVSRQVRTDGQVALREAYGVGTQVVAKAGQVGHHLYCRRGEIFAARTTIGWKRHGTRLLLVTVEGKRGRRQHGLDENQMSGLLVQLGAERAYALDGGGSTSLITRMRRHHHRLSSRIQPSWGLRPIPVGLGVFARRRAYRPPSPQEQRRAVQAADGYRW